MIRLNLFSLPQVAIGLTISTLMITQSHASEVEGTVKYIKVRASDGLHWIEINGTATPRPACASNFRYYAIRQEQTDAGKAQLAMLMSAFLARRKVYLRGAHSCVRWGDAEDIEAVELID